MLYLIPIFNQKKKKKKKKKKNIYIFYFHHCQFFKIYNYI